MASIQIKNLVKRYDKAETIRKVDLQIDNGEFVVFVGPSGCGKSTLLRMIAGLESISDGELYIDDHVITSYSIHYTKLYDRLWPQWRRKNC